MVAKISAGYRTEKGNTTKLTCPICRHAGMFYPVVEDAKWTTYEDDGRHQYAMEHAVGLRRCPNPECSAVVYVTFTQNRLLAAMPSPTIDFDATNLPPDILASFEEAIRCHAAGCFKAASLMVRRTLEELCKDKNANGRDLKARIQALRETVVISSDLLEAADELRLLGNDAAHIEAKAYDAIDAEEVEVAIELTKELLKAVYQHTSLVARLKALKKQPNA